MVAPFSFAHFGQSGSLNREGDFLLFPYSTRNPIQFTVPELLYKEGGLIDVPHENSASSQSSCLYKLMNIWRTDYIHKSLWEEKCLPNITSNCDLTDRHFLASSFSFLRLIGVSPQEAHELHMAPLIRKRLLATQAERQLLDMTPYLSVCKLTISKLSSSLTYLQ